MLIESLLLGLVLLLGTKRLNGFLDRADYRGLTLPMAAFALEAAAGFALKGPLELTVRGLSFWIQLAVYGLLGGFICLNYKRQGFLLAGAGLALNALVVLSNGGFMPVDGSLLASLGFTETYRGLSEGDFFAHGLMQSQTHFSMLGDVIHLPPPYPFPKSISLGDVLLGFGVLIHLTGRKEATK